jgi:TetR/AcrR family transcriptional regulator, regulator of cefoperazone and chloramphenicol sensitivity
MDKRRRLSSGTPTRAYHSSIRARQALETRVRIRQAARELFVRRGFAGTTIADIAALAGVAEPTVYAAFESKAGIVIAMLEELHEGARTEAGLATLFAEADPRRQLEGFVAAHCSLLAKGADILRAARVAASHPDVAALAGRGDAARRRVIDELVEGWRRTGALRAELDPDDAAERIWLLTTVEGYLTAVDQLGWSTDRYRVWLGSVLEREVLGPVQRRLRPAQPAQPGRRPPPRGRRRATG